MSKGHNQGYSKSSDTHFNIFYAANGESIWYVHVSEILKHQFVHSVFKAAHILEPLKRTSRLSESKDLNLFSNRSLLPRKMDFKVEIFM